MSEHKTHVHSDSASPCGCCLSMGRRDFMTTVGVSALAAQTGIMGLASTLMADSPRRQPKPRIRAVFVHPKTDRYWMGWPGASYDIAAMQADYTKIMRQAAVDEGVDLEVTDAPIATPAAMDALLNECKTSPPDGVIVTVMCLNSGWRETDRFVTERPQEISTIVFSPMGTSFTGHLQKTRNQPRTLVAATQDIGWLAEGVHLLKTIAAMKSSRLLIVNGDKTEDKVLDVIGTTLHHIPLDRWVEELNAVGTSDEMKQLAAEFTRRAEKIREPNPDDIMKAARNYFVARRLMTAEECDGISINCLGLVGSRRIDCPPCMAWMQLNDEGSVGCCECDWNAAISLRLCALLTGRPGFMQDPCPNTISGTLMGAHCSSPTKIHGFDKDPAPLILRNHSESAIGVSPQVIWPEGAAVTIMKFDGPKRMLLSTATVKGNIDTPPAGGCRTSVDLVVDNKDDPRDCLGFHQLFVCGRVDRQVKNYCELAGIEVVPA
jgi:hypothetical protein